MLIRVRSRKRRNKLKPVWDLILVENLTSVFSQLFACVHMNWGKMKLSQYEFRISHFDWNKILKRHEIFMWTKFTQSEMNKRRLVGYCFQCACAFETHCGFGFHIDHFDRNELGNKVSCKYYPSRFEMQPKWNVIWAELVFTQAWNLNSVWVLFHSHVNELLSP